MEIDGFVELYETVVSNKIGVNSNLVSKITYFHCSVQMLLEELDGFGKLAEFAADTTKMGMYTLASTLTYLPAMFRYFWSELDGFLELLCSTRLQYAVARTARSPSSTAMLVELGGFDELAEIVVHNAKITVSPIPESTIARLLYAAASLTRGPTAIFRCFVELAETVARRTKIAVHCFAAEK